MLQIKLIALYYYVCHYYSTKLQWQVQRFSPNSLQGQITDQELLTIYLFCTAFEQKPHLKAMYACIQNHWLSYFPTLPSYQTFSARLNRLSDCLPLLVEELSAALQEAENGSLWLCLGDSMPIITCSGKRKGKVAPDYTDKGYCATKGLYYYGLKLHLLAWSRKSKLPLPEQLWTTPASAHDLTAIRPVLEQIRHRTIVLDKAYADEKLRLQLETQQQTLLLTPLKVNPHLPRNLQLFDKAHDDLFSGAVSSIRQPIESLFSWIQEKTQIQNASKVRSAKGLMLHVFGKIAAALFLDH